MPEKNNKEDKRGDWQGMDCTTCHAHHPRYFAIRWVLGLIILFLVFWVGLKIGEFKGYFDNYGYSSPMNYRYGHMMSPGGYRDYWTDTQPAPATPSTSTTKPSTPTK